MLYLAYPAHPVLIKPEVRSQPSFECVTSLDKANWLVKHRQPSAPLPGPAEKKKKKKKTLHYCRVSSTLLEKATKLCYPIPVGTVVWRCMFVLYLALNGTYKYLLKGYNPSGSFFFCFFFFKNCRIVAKAFFTEETRESVHP